MEAIHLQLVYNSSATRELYMNQTGFLEAKEFFTAIGFHLK